MSCPSCKSPLVILEWDAIELDYCTACGGAWLDAGELETIAVRAGAAPGNLSRILDQAGQGASGRRRCVRCAARMEIIQAGAGDPVSLDRCPRGHGFWCDNGEIRQLVIGAAKQGAEAQAVANFFATTLGSRL